LLKDYFSIDLARSSFTCSIETYNISISNIFVSIMLYLYLFCFCRFVLYCLCLRFQPLLWPLLCFIHMWIRNLFLLCYTALLIRPFHSLYLDNRRRSNLGSEYLFLWNVKYWLFPFHDFLVSKVFQQFHFCSHLLCGFEAVFWRRSRSIILHWPLFV